MGSGSAYNWPTVDTKELYKSKRGWRQKAPYVPAVYTLDQVKRSSVSGYNYNPSPNTYSNGAMVASFSGYSRAVTDATNKAYASFLDDVSSRAAFAANIAEGRQSFQMIANRASQLRIFSRQVKARKFKSAAETLGMAFIPPGVSIKKSYANNWLEFWFGWKPLITDIYSAINQIQQPIKNHVARGTGRSYWTQSYVPGGYNANWSHERFIGVRTQAEVAVTNPNLWLANTLGLINPASVLWELVPFSFVVDWFFNVGQVLNSYTDLCGLTLKNPCTSVLVRGTTNEWWTTYGWKAKFSTVYMSRSTGVTLPSLIRKPLRQPSATRAITAISLLIQQLH